MVQAEGEIEVVETAMFARVDDERWMGLDIRVAEEQYSRTARAGALFSCGSEGRKNGLR